MSVFPHFMQTVTASMNATQLIEFHSPNDNQCIFIKDHRSAYCYANNNYIQLMGLRNFKQLQQLDDNALSKHQTDAIKYRELDQCTLDEQMPLDVCEKIYPYLNQPIVKTMQGKLYPLFNQNGNAHYVLGVVKPTSKLLKLDFDTLFNLSQELLTELLIKRSYTIQVEFGEITLSKMEIKTLIELIKGARANDIAQALQIKQTTVESYLIHIKNKLFVTSKSELINKVLRQKILEQIIL